MRLGLSVVAVWLGLVAWPLHAADKARPDLRGEVQGEKGEPLAGATVFIYTAGPKQGVGVLCPYCYDDCKKRATTDAEGKFKIEALDPALLFRVLIVAKGRQPEFLSKIDPAEKEVTAKLKPVNVGEAQNQRIRGKVVNAQGKPVAEAVVSIRSLTRDGITRYGGYENIDPVAVTDQAGEFALYASKAFEELALDVEARNFAKATFHKLTVGQTAHELKVVEGVSVTGRLVKDGKPVAGAEVGISGAERWSEVYVGSFTVATDADGRFLFVNLPPKTDYFLYGGMKSLRKKGTVPAKRIRAGDDGSTQDAGELKVQSGFAIAGQIKLADGKPVPPKTRVMLSREDAGDSQQVDADAEGRFRFTGVPAEPVSVSARVKDYQMTVRNASLDPLNPYHLIGAVTGNKTNLVLEFEPGSERRRLDGDQQALYKEPLRGAESGGERTGDIEVAGTVTDADTGKPLAKFTVTEGRRDDFRQDFNWLPSRKSTETNGAFTVYFTKQRQPPGVLIEAEGYLPQASPPVTGTKTNLVIQLKKGSGTAGVIKLSDGKPAEGVTVYLIDARNSLYVDSKAGPRTNMGMSRSTISTRADAAGHFSFAPLIGAFSIMVYDDAGFAEVRVEELAKQPEVQLQPWSRVEGQLLIGTKPGNNETVRLGLASLPYAHHPRVFAPLSLFLTVTSDVSGRFIFERVPPVSVELYHEPKVRDSRVGIIPQAQETRFLLKPGETRQVVLGGKGRPVIGRVDVNGYEGKIDWRTDVHSLERVVDDPPELPGLAAVSKEYGEALRAAKTDEEKAAAKAAYERQREEHTRKAKEFYATEAGRNHYFQHGRYALNFKPDGTFRIEDVPGGKYTLNIDLHEGNADGPMRMSAPRIANLRKDIEIPGEPGGRSDEPVDLGTIEMWARNSMKAGKVAPDFEVKTLEDKPLKLSDFKGKYVLLDFWAVWCGPCVAETPHLKEAYAAFKDDPRFAMIGLSLDPDTAAPRDYAKKNELGWIHGFLGEWSKTELPSRFGVEGIPSIFLIGPDGKIVASGLRGENIKSAVQAALKSK